MLTPLTRLLTPLARVASWLYPRPDDAQQAQIEQLLDGASFVHTYRPGVVDLLLALHAAGLDAAGLTRVATFRMVRLTPENEATAQHALAAGDWEKLPPRAETFDLNADYFHVLGLTHARGSFAGLYYLPLEFNGNVHKLSTVWLHAWPEAPPPPWAGEVVVHYVA
jgi:hypothetical protein